MRTGCVFCNGGNCAITPPGSREINHGVVLHGIKNIPGMLASSSTWMFANNIYHMVKYYTRDGQFVEGRIHSFIQTQGTRPRLDPTDKVAQHMRSLSETDFRGQCGLDISDNGTLTRKTR